MDGLYLLCGINFAPHTYQTGSLIPAWETQTRKRPSASSPYEQDPAMKGLKSRNRDWTMQSPYTDMGIQQGWTGSVWWNDNETPGSLPHPATTLFPRRPGRVQPWAYLIWPISELVAKNHTCTKNLTTDHWDLQLNLCERPELRNVTSGFLNL